MAGAYLGFTLGHASDAILNSYTADPLIKVAGTDRTDAILQGDARLSLALGQPGSFAFGVDGRDFTPTRGQEVIVYDDGSTGGVRWFGGTITEVSTQIDRAANSLIYQCVAQDYRWLLDRYALVRKTWYSRGVNCIVRDIIANFTDGGFTPGYLPASLGTLDVFSATDERVTQVLARLAASAGAYVEIDATKRVSMFTTPDHQSAGTVAITNTSNNVAGLTVKDDLTDIATRVRAIAGGTTLREAVIASETNYLAVYDVAPFGSSSGSALVGSDLVTYTGSTNVTGAEKLVSISGLTQDWPIGTPVLPIVTAEDSSAQTDLATLLGGGLSGIAVLGQRDETWTRSEASARASAALGLLKAGVTTVSGSQVDAQHTGARNAWPGASVSVSMTDPITLSGTYRLQAVTLAPLTVGGAQSWLRQWEAGPVARGTELIDLLGAL